MDLMDEIDEIIEGKKETKKDVLKRVAGDEILKMIENGITIQKQVELLLKFGVVEKLDRAEYTRIITKHFWYVPKKNKSKIKVKSSVEVKSINKKDDTQTVEDKLSQEVDLMAIHLKKKAEERENR